MAVSNNVTSAVNLIALLCSIPIISSGIWLASKPDNECIRWLRWPVLFFGIAVVLVSLAGFVGAHWNRHGLLSLYLFFMAALILLSLILIVLAFVVTRPDGYVPASPPVRPFPEYRLAGFSPWLLDHVTNSDNWPKISACLARSDSCPRLNRRYLSADQFFTARISPLQSGCCKPPAACGFQYVNPTMWVNPANTLAEPDCAMWSNDQSQLCYSCDSCKAGLLGNLRREWRKANIILIVTVVALCCMYLVACNAFKNAQIGRGAHK
ncbi:tetraspanin-2-like [Diospyros lotus]|uniref:tetraspanin-2-like n=1 Tax=Diospyros lotus TaxID=55363 RepID=UPI00225488B2|nr:tetraspanin-2-like [Diospyros lotus]